eukprot:12235716-Prorocentrum_lima.AAC.1
MYQFEGQVLRGIHPCTIDGRARLLFFEPDKEEKLMNEAKETDTPKTGEADPFIKERDQSEEDQLLK